MEQKSSVVFYEISTAVTFEISLSKSVSALNMLYTG